MFGFSIDNNNGCTYKKYNEDSYSIGDKLLIPEIRRVLCKPFENQFIANSMKIVVSFLKTHGNFSIELRSHTDFRDADSNNYVLSLKLATMYSHYLLSKGIESHRVKPIGIGESEPFIIDKCFREKYPQFEIGDTLNVRYIKNLENKEDRETAHTINRRN